MRLDLSTDSVAVEATREDVDLARALRDTVESAQPLAEALGVGVIKCEWCEQRNGPLRSYDLIVDGEFRALDICADCQATHVGNAEAQYREGEDG